MATEDIREEIQSRAVTEVAELWPPQHEWTEEDYFALPETNRLIELSEGELIVPPHPTLTHQRIASFLFTIFRSFAEAHDLGIMLFAPYPVRLWPGTVREPDLLFFFHAHTDRMAEQAAGPPDLVVEVTSPSTRTTDRRDKREEYARAGIPEYWLVDYEDRTIEVFVLRDGAYHRLITAGAGETASSELPPGLEVAVDDVFAR